MVRKGVRIAGTFLRYRKEIEVRSMRCLSHGTCYFSTSWNKNFIFHHLGIPGTRSQHCSASNNGVLFSPTRWFSLLPSAVPGIGLQRFWEGRPRNRQSPAGMRAKTALRVTQSGRRELPVAVAPRGRLCRAALVPHDGRCLPLLCPGWRRCRAATGANRGSD